MASIYNINGWVNGTLYKKHDIVQLNGKFWYALQGHTAATSTNKPDSGTQYEAHWGGFIYSAKTQEDRPFFLWSPDYNISTQNLPKVSKISFGDGYSQRVTEGINSSLLRLTLSFTKRTEKEAVAIVHFLTARGAKHFFHFKVPEPYNIIKKFVCPSWTSVLNFHDNFNVTVQFEEVS